MAATFYSALVPTDEVSSAGTFADYAGKLLGDVAIRGLKVMKEIGFDMSHNPVTQLTPEMVERAEKIILMGPTPAGPLPEYLARSPKLETWDVPDPGYGLILHADARDRIRALVNNLVERRNKGILEA